MNVKQDLTVEEAQQLFNYDPLSGVLSWRNDAGRWGRIKAGSPVGCQCTTGHLQVRLKGRSVMVHRICFTLANGRAPTFFVDHINGNPADNRAVNLRDVSKSANNQNIKRPNSLSRHGWLGVRRNGRLWASAISISGKQRHLGSYATPEEAHAAYIAAKREYHEGNTL